MIVFTWIADHLGFLADWFDKLSDAGATLPIVGGWVSAWFYSIGGYFRTIGGYFRSVQEWWDWLADTWKKVVDEALVYFDAWITWLSDFNTSHLAPFFSRINLKILKGWITENFDLTLWINDTRAWLQEFVDSYVKDVNFLLNFFARVYEDWTEPFRKVLPDADLAAWLNSNFKLAPWVSWIQTTYTSLQDSIGEAFEPAWPWQRVKDWLDDWIEDERDWLYNQANRVLDRLW